MKTCIKNINEIIGIVPEGILRKQGAEMNETGTLSDAYLLIKDGYIADFGSMNNLPQADEYIDAEGGMVMPSFCDSHTHIVYAGSRDGEFLDKINGLSYEEIAQRGGGILNSADLLHNTSEDELYSQAMVRVNEMIGKGTGAIEIKSGYGLNTEDELKILRVIQRIKETCPAIIRSTFLGAHAVGRGYSHDEYVRLICEEMIPIISQLTDKSSNSQIFKSSNSQIFKSSNLQIFKSSNSLADFIDVFCDEGFFTVEDTDRILTVGEQYGLRAKIHANELAVSGGVQIGVRHNALSVDHLEKTTDAEIQALQGTETMPTMLPGSSFFLGLPFGRAKDFINAGLGVALASDYNPGSSPSGDMRFVMAMGCIRMRLTPIQAFNAVTLNSAYAMGISDEAGSITRGKRANLIITRPIKSFTMIPYMYQTPFIKQHILQGKLIGVD